MAERDRIVEIIVGTLKQIDPSLKQVSEATNLVGADAVVDSVGFVNFLVTLEHAFGRPVDLSTLFIEQSDSGDGGSPFRHVGSMADLIARSLDSSS